MYPLYNQDMGASTFLEKRRAAHARAEKKKRDSLLVTETDPRVTGTTCWAEVKVWKGNSRDGYEGKIEREPVIDPETGKQATKRCGQQPVKGQRTCSFHGGRSPSSMQRGLERQAIAKAKASLIKLGISVQGDPREILLAQVYASYGMMLGAQQLVQMIPDPSAVFEESEDGLKYQAYLALYESWVDRAAKVAKMALDADIDERMVHLAENQAQAMVMSLKAVVLSEALKLSPEQAELALKLLGDQLRTYTPVPLNAGQPASDILGGTVAYETSGGKMRVGG